ncbi:MAG TPA: DUF2752 domain-containing protein [Pyrinomonadaceae bacterium]|nr:DUF2752 domain-containing protein [Pyrinomonadaceae bacterium]
MSLDEIFSRRLTVVLIWLTLAAGATYLWIFEPGRSGFFPACPFRLLTGFACPGCGSTRGMHALIHGDVLTAFKFNPFLVLALPFLIYVLLRHTNAVLRKQPINRNRLNAKYIWALFVVILGFWIFRNTPLYPFPV